MQNSVTYPHRVGTRPATSKTNPHRQLEQNAPEALQEELFALMKALPGVRVEGTGIPEFDGFDDKGASTGTRAIVLDQALAQGPRDAFLIGTEFCHIHAADDGSLHLALPERVRKQLVEGGWGESHPLAGQTIHDFYATPAACLVFGPRTEDELRVIWQFVQASYAFARGESES